MLFHLGENLVGGHVPDMAVSMTALRKPDVRAGDVVRRLVALGDNGSDSTSPTCVDQSICGKMQKEGIPCCFCSSQWGTTTRWAQRAGVYAKLLAHDDIYFCCELD